MEAALHPWPALGALLMRDGLVSREQLEAVLSDQRDSPHQRISGKRLGEALVEQGVVTQAQVAQLVAEQYTLPFIELTESEIGIRAAVLVSEELARRALALPISVLPDGSLLVAVADPPLALFSDELHGALGVPLRFAVATADAMDAAITYAFERARLLAAPDEPEPSTTDEASGGPDAEPTNGASAGIDEPVLVGLTRPWPALGTLLIRDGIVSEEELDAALAQQRVSGSKRLGEILVERGAVTPTDVTRLVAEQYELPFVDLVESEVEPEIATLLPEDLARRWSAVPVSARDGEVLVALADPTRALDAHELRSAFDSAVRFVAASPEAVEAAIVLVHAAVVEPEIEDATAQEEDAPGTFDPNEGSFEPDEGKLEPDEGSFEPDEGMLEPDEAPLDYDETAELELDEAMTDDLLEATASVRRWESPETEAPVLHETTVTVLETGAETETDSGSPEALHELMERTLALGASHVHLAPGVSGTLVRVRVDGVMRDVEVLTADTGMSLSAALKELARLDATERKTPREGRIAYSISGETVDLRLSVVPTARGEKLTLTVREPDSARLSLGDLGLQPEDEGLLRSALQEPLGAVVVCGPVGSGRTSTLYAALRELATPEHSVATVEHPVERPLGGIDQVEVSPSSGLTYARGLRAVLRSDPDVVAVGEIHDDEIAHLTMRAAGGHLVLATMEAQSSAAAVRRLAHSSKEPGVVGTALTLVVSQRLVRRICTECRETYYADADELAELGRPPEETGRRLLARGRGCTACGDTGYRGRVGLFELLSVGEEIRRLVDVHAPVDEIQRAAVGAGMRTLHDEGVRLSLDGVTTPAEVRRVLGSRTA